MEKICLLCGMCIWCELSTPKIVQLLWSQIINREFGLRKWVLMLVSAQCKQMHCLLIELFSKMWIFRLVVSSFFFFICLSHVSLYTICFFYRQISKKTIWLKIGRGLLIVPTSFVSRHRQSVSSFKSNKLYFSHVNFVVHSFFAVCCFVLILSSWSLFTFSILWYCACAIVLFDDMCNF